MVFGSNFINRKIKISQIHLRSAKFIKIKV